VILSKYKQFVKDYFFASSFQLFNVISPFLVIYLVIPIIEKKLYANVLLVTSLASYFKLLYDYGFEYFGAKKINSTSSNELKSIVFSGIMNSKLIIVVILVIPQILLSYFLLIDKNLVFIISHVSGIIFLGLNPFWYFTAMKKFNLLALINLIIQFVFILLIIILIKNKEDWMYYGLAYSISQFLGLVISVFILQRNGVRYHFKFNLTGYFIKKSFSIMSFGVLSNVYVSSTVILLKFFNISSEMITDFGIAEKIVRGIRQIISPINRILYPRLAKLYLVSFSDFKKLIWNGVSLITFLGVSLTIGLFVFKEQIFELLNFPINQNLLNLTNLLSPIFIVGSLAGFLSYGYMITTNKESQLLKILFITIIIFLLANILLVPKYHAIGAAIAILISETILVLSIFSISKAFRK
tara:strand:+ start:1110 stop:2342 length:1233 start_codon:yes stop_codon:yes gene_type:complete